MRGATVIMTRTDDTGVGPCVNVRAAIGNAAGADAAISIHADGGRCRAAASTSSSRSRWSAPSATTPPSCRRRPARRRRCGPHSPADTGEPTSDYAGVDGVDPRNDLGGLDLTTVPKVLIECANMQNPVDAALTE